MGGVCFPATSASYIIVSIQTEEKKGIEREGGTPISPTLIIKSKSKFKSSLHCQKVYLCRLDILLI